MDGPGGAGAIPGDELDIEAARARIREAFNLLSKDGKDNIAEECVP